uniref:Uncharacterized protein n=1 Tax=Opuntia streptacantha TaxID=393608 RepID=A0A7C9E919_OPUST
MLRYFLGAFFPSSMILSTLGILNNFSVGRHSLWFFLLQMPPNSSCLNCVSLPTFIYLASGQYLEAQLRKRFAEIFCSAMATFSTFERYALSTKIPSASICTSSFPNGRQ